MEKLTEKINKLNTDYDECAELNENVNLKFAGFYELKLTRERYIRYLNGITVWELDDTDMWYLRDLILKFVKETNNMKKTDMTLYLKMMKRIDRELKNMVDTIHAEESSCEESESEDETESTCCESESESEMEID